MSRPGRTLDLPASVALNVDLEGRKAVVMARRRHRPRVRWGVGARGSLIMGSEGVARELGVGGGVICFKP